MIENAYELYKLLEKQELLSNKPYMWWPKYGSFEVIVGAILMQNTQWTRVEISLENLRQNNLLNLDALCVIEIEELQKLIQPSGLFKSKAMYLQTLAIAIKKEFGNFEDFCRSVERVWLLNCKGVGPETADSILCYACKRNSMVVDTYTSRLLSAFGLELDGYEALQNWCVKGLEPYFKEDERFKVYALFHGMIVEFVKRNSMGKKVNIENLQRR